jgi:hypothetical protein
MLQGKKYSKIILYNKYFHFLNWLMSKGLSPNILLYIGIFYQTNTGTGTVLTVCSLKIPRLRSTIKGQ